MYSKELSGLFTKLHVAVGDTISISSKKTQAEGILMPRPDVGENDIIVIKKKDGYNIGIRYDKDMKISKIAAGSGNFSFPKAEAKQDKSLHNISLLYTGGTIGAKIDYVSGGVYMLTKPEELLHEVPELSGIANIAVSNITSIASEDMTYTGWQAMAKGIVNAFENGARGVVITHGTDTMHYTSAALSFMLQDLNGPVVITGAQRSSDRGSSDAFLNLICSASVAAKSDFAEVGICMHSNSSDKECNLMRGVKVRKMHTSRRDAFRAINDEPVASVDQNGNISYKSQYRKIRKPGTKVSALTEFEKKVALVKAYPNSDPEILEYYAGKGYKGIIIEAMGLGHVPTPASKAEYEWISHMKNAVDNGLVLGITSQCLYGRVNPVVYRNLRLASGTGAIYCEDMLPEVAYVKLGFLLGNYKADKAKQMLNVNIAGEITERSQYKDDFIE